MGTRGRQKGFLAIVAILLVVIVGFIAVTATYQFTGDSLSSVNHLNSSQAFYLAQSGISSAKASVLGGTSCSSYSSGAVSLGQGQYSATGAANLSSTTLSGNITNTATTIPLTSTSGFTTSGVIAVDSEFITYSGISGSSLTGATRGVSGTVAVAHSSGAAVAENECVLTSVGAVPSIASPVGKRTLKMILPGVGFSIGTQGTSASGFVIPALAATAQISLGAGTINNPVVTSSSPSFPGSTAYTSANFVINNSGTTQVDSSGGSLTTSSSVSGGVPNVKADVTQNGALINSSNLWSTFFTQSQATVQAAANQSYTSANISGAHGQTIWVNGGSGLNIGNGVTIGTPTSPVILIIGAGNLQMQGTATIYGFVYVNSTFELAMQDTAQIIGAVAVNGPVDMNGSAPSITLDPTILSLLNITNSNTTNKYSGNPISFQEQFN